MYAGFRVVCIRDFLSFILSLQVPTHPIDALNGVYRIPSLPESQAGSDAPLSPLSGHIYIQVPWSDCKFPTRVWTPEVVRTRSLSTERRVGTPSSLQTYFLSWGKILPRWSVHFFFKETFPPRQEAELARTYRELALAEEWSISRPRKPGQADALNFRVQYTRPAAETNQKNQCSGRGRGKIATLEVACARARIPCLGSWLFSLAGALAGSAVIHSLGSRLARAAAAATAEGGA